MNSPSRSSMRTTLRRTATAVSRYLPHRRDFPAPRRHWRTDLLAGLTVSIVALPLALGYGVATGVGATAGLVAAIVAGAVAALFGGSSLQVSGPTGTMAVVLVPIVAVHGPGAVYTVGLLTGIFLLLLAFLRAGRLIRYIPEPVVEGFTLGIAVIIFIQQIPLALGFNGSHTHVILEAGEAAAHFAERPDWTAAAITAATVVLILAGGRLKPRWPLPIIAIILATTVELTLPLDATTVGRLPTGLPAPTFSLLDLALVKDLATGALAVATLIAIESLMSAKVADGMTVDQHHDPDRELFGQGLSNLVSPLFGGIPSSGALARTAVNTRSGATTRLAALSHSAILLLFLLALAPLVSHIPLSALAGVLMATAVRMVKVSSLTAICSSTRHDAAVLVATAAITVSFDLIVALVLGIALAGGVALHKLSKTLEVNREEPDTSEHRDEEARLLKDHIVAYRLDGPLFFAAGHNFLLQFAEVADVKVVVLRLSRVSKVDATGARVLWDVVRRLERRGVVVLVSGLPERHRKVCFALGEFDRLERQGRLLERTADAIAEARQYLRDEDLYRCKPYLLDGDAVDRPESRKAEADPGEGAGEGYEHLRHREYPE